jgi:hypothetical protein
MSEAIPQFSYFSYSIGLYAVLRHRFCWFHPFAAFMHILKRTVQRWNNHIVADCEIDYVINSLLYKNGMNGNKSVLFNVSNKPVTSKVIKCTQIDAF